MADPLTPIERRVYHYLLDFLAEHSYQPSIREIGKRFRIKSTKTVSDILGVLADKGYIERDPSRSRGVRILGYVAPARTQPVPIYRDIAAGEPPLVQELRDGYLTLDRRFLPNDEVFVLRIEGDSMTGRGIFDNDFVLINPSTRALDGQVVAARLGANATVKTLTHRGATIVLEPANPADRETIVGPNDNFAVLGVVCGVFRPLYDAAEQGTVALPDEDPDSEPDAAA
jgi:repressor LexA